MGGLLLTFPSCADTVDEHFNAGDGTSATETLWDIISSKPELSKFKNIAEKATFYRDEEHPQANYTFKDMLQGSMLITAYVPVNDAITDAEYQHWLELAEGKESGYTVQQQLMANSITLWRQVATGGGIDTLTMLNAKKMEFDKNQFTMQQLPIKEANIPATNGTLHIMNSTIPFRYNLYEYLKDATNAQQNNVSVFHDFLIQNDTTYFNENISIEGNPDIDGNPTYVDSVYTTSNTMFFGTKRFPTDTSTDKYLTYDESFGANIIAEDSTFILLMPTDNAWENAYKKLEPYYNYASIYADKEKMDQGTTNVYRNVSNPDSLKEKNITMDIASPLCFNLHFQPNGADQIGRWKLDDFLADNGQTPTYFLNTFGDTLRSDENWDKAALLQGNQIRLSNGVAIVKDEWDFPLKLFKPDLHIEIGSRAFYNSSNAVGTARSVAFSNATAAAWVDSVGRVTKDNFYYIYPQSASGNPRFDFILRGTDGENYESEVMSGKYDIYAVMVPDFYLISSDSIVHTIGATAYVTDEGDTIPMRHKIRATISYNNGAANGREATQQSAVVEYTGEKVDTLLLFEDFEFPVSYKNLRHSYPTLQLTTSTSAQERRKGYSNAFCIDGFILRSKEN